MFMTTSRLITHSVVQARLPRAGMCNKLLVWARAYSFSRINNLPLYVYRWSDFKVGPMVRKERSLRNYSNVFWGNSCGSFYRSKVTQLFGNNTVIRNPNPQSAAFYHNHVYNFSSFPNWPFYFRELDGCRNIIIDGFKKLVKPRFSSLFVSGFSPVVGVHVRLSDFRPSTYLSEHLLACNIRTPLDYFVHVINSLREISSSTLPVTVFTDGHANEINELLSLPAVKLYRGKSDIEELITLSKSSVIIPSASSSFSYWAAFISNSHVVMPVDSNIVLSPEIWGLNRHFGSVDSFKPSNLAFDIH